MISARDLRSLYIRWMSEVATNVWMRGVRAYFTASQQRSISARPTRLRPQIDGAPSSVPTWRATARVASKSSSDEMGNPASMTSTLRRASCRAISSFSIVFMETRAAGWPPGGLVSKRRPQPMPPPGLSAYPPFALRRARHRRAADDEPPQRPGQGIAGEQHEQEQLVVRRNDHDRQHDHEQRSHRPAPSEVDLLEAPVAERRDHHQRHDVAADGDGDFQFLRHLAAVQVA